MKGSIEKLLALTDFNSEKLVDAFLVQFRKDFAGISPSNNDVLELADNLLGAVSEVFNHANQMNEMDLILKRLELLDEYLSKRRSDSTSDEWVQLAKDASSASELWCAINTIREQLIEEEKKRPVVEDIAKHCKECESHLRQIILTEANKLPNGGVQYCIDMNSHQISLDKINLDALSADLYKNEGSFAKGGVYHKRASRELTEAVRSYETTKRLHATLNVPGATFSNKLDSFKKEYEKEATKNDLQANPDPKVKTFFKVVGYVLANIFTVGTLHLATKGSFLMSKPQKLHKRAKEVIEEVDSPKKRK